MNQRSQHPEQYCVQSVFEQLLQLGLLAAGAPFVADDDGVVLRPAARVRADLGDRRDHLDRGHPVFVEPQQRAAQHLRILVALHRGCGMMPPMLVCSLKAATMGDGLLEQSD